MIGKSLAGLGLALLALVPLAGGTQEATQEPAAQLEALIERFETARKEFITAYRAATTPEEREAALETRPKGSDYVGEFLALAESDVGTDTAAQAFTWVLRLADESTKTEVIQVAVEGLIRDHIDSEAASELPGLVSGLGRSIGNEKARGFLRQIVSDAPKGPVLAGGLFSLAQNLVEDDEAGPESRTEAVAMFKRVVAEFGELEGPRGATYADMAGAWLFDLERLQVGMHAPDIEANDLQGVSFKLSEYEGKVVLLDFWGNW